MFVVSVLRCAIDKQGVRSIVIERKRLGEKEVEKKKRREKR